jgi:hypothetical protein
MQPMMALAFEYWENSSHVEESACAKTRPKQDHRFPAGNNEIAELLSIPAVPARLTAHILPLTVTRSKRLAADEAENVAGPPVPRLAIEFSCPPTSVCVAESNGFSKIFGGTARAAGVQSGAEAGWTWGLTIMC